MNEKGNALLAAAILIVLLLAGGFYLLRNQFSDKTQIVDKLEEAAYKKKEEVSDVVTEKAEDLMSMIILDELTKSGALKDVSGGDGTGVAFALRRDGKLYHTVSASLPDITNGTFYEGWLVRKEPALLFFSTGEMTRLADGTYTLAYTSDSAYEGYDFVVITLEKVKDATPEAHILEGTVE